MCMTPHGKLEASSIPQTIQKSKDKHGLGLAVMVTCGYRVRLSYMLSFETLCFFALISNLCPMSCQRRGYIFQDCGLLAAPSSSATWLHAHPPTTCRPRQPPSRRCRVPPPPLPLIRNRCPPQLPTASARHPPAQPKGQYILPINQLGFLINWWFNCLIGQFFFTGAPGCSRHETFLFPCILHAVCCKAVPLVSGFKLQPGLPASQTAIKSQQISSPPPRD